MLLLLPRTAHSSSSVSFRGLCTHLSPHSSYVNLPRISQLFQWCCILWPTGFPGFVYLCTYTLRQVSLCYLLSFLRSLSFPSLRKLCFLTMSTPSSLVSNIHSLKFSLLSWPDCWQRCSCPTLSGGLRFSSKSSVLKVNPMVIKGKSLLLTPDVQVCYWVRFICFHLSFCLLPAELRRHHQGPHAPRAI